MSKKVYIFLADGFEDIEGLTVVDLLRRAEIEIHTVSIKNTKEVQTAHGISLLTDKVFGEVDFQMQICWCFREVCRGQSIWQAISHLQNCLQSFTMMAGKLRQSVPLPAFSQGLVS